MIHLKTYSQKSGFCAPASLKIILSYYGKNFSENYLSRLCKTDPAIGTFHKDIIAAAKKIGFKVEARSHGTTSDIKNYMSKKIPVLVGWYAFNGDHFSVVNHITSNYIHLTDPETKSGRRRLRLKRFKELWYDFDDEKDAKKKTYGWYLVLKPPK